MRNSRALWIALFAVMLAGATAVANEVPIGQTKRISAAGMEVAAVYLQPIDMEPETLDGHPLYLPRAQADVHLEADIHALAGNKQGFRDGEWIPALTVHYALKNLESGAEQAGTLHPMVASDGPHYGANVKMPGTGRYHLTFVVEPPGTVPAGALVRQGFGRAPSSAAWWAPVRLEWTFDYLGTPKAGY